MQFDDYLALWRLVPDGSAIVTRGARLLPVRRDGEAAMLKVAIESEERAEGERSLSEFARNGRDEEATRIICDVIAELHAPRAKPLPELIPLSVWFRELEPAAGTHGGILARSAETARSLLADPKEPVVLHGDIHHDNILDFGERGWLAIDPKRLFGERGFDYANLFCNPDLSDPAHPVATVPAHFAKRLEIVVERSGIERRRLLQWMIAWCGLSAAWFIGDGESPEIDLRIAALAIAELER